ADLAVEELLLEVGILMRFDGAEARHLRVAAEAGVDVERAVRLERELVVAGDRTDHVPDAGDLRVERAPDAVAAVARVAGLVMWHEAAHVVHRRERAVVRLEARDDR